MNTQPKYNQEQSSELTTKKEVKPHVSVVRDGELHLSQESVSILKKVHKPGLFKLLDVISRSH